MKYMQPYIDGTATRFQRDVVDFMLNEVLLRAGYSRQRAVEILVAFPDWEKGETVFSLKPRLLEFAAS